MRLQMLLLSSLLFCLIAAAVVAPAQESNPVYRQVMEKKQLRIGISRNYPPLNFYGKKGVEIDLARDLGKFLGVEVELTPLALAEYLPALTGKRVDIIIAGLSRSLKRAQTIWFSEPYILITPGVLASASSLPQTRFGDSFEQNPIRTIWDIRAISGFKLAVKEDSAYEDLLLESFPGMPLLKVKTNGDGLHAVLEGKAHGFVHDSLYLQYIHRANPKYRAGFRLLQGGNRHEYLCVGIPFGEVLLKNQIDTFIQELKRRGVIDELLEKYNAQ